MNNKYVNSKKQNVEGSSTDLLNSIYMRKENMLETVDLEENNDDIQVFFFFFYILI